MQWTVLYLFHLVGSDVYALTPFNDAALIPRLNPEASWTLLEIMERKRLSHPTTPNDEQALEAPNRDGFYVFKMPDGYSPREHAIESEEGERDHDGRTHHFARTRRGDCPFKAGH